MALSNDINTDPLISSPYPSEYATRNAYLNSSAVSWSAILAGAAVAAVLSLILLLLGTGLGLSSVSPWAHKGVDASTLGISTIVWITVTQILASGMGDIAGRLRTKWAGVHTDEVYFRDTAHGFLAWTVATLATAALLTSTVASIVGSGTQAAASLAGGAATAAIAGGAAAAATAVGKGEALSLSGDAGLGYFMDTLFRSDPNLTPPSDAATNGTQNALPLTEAARIFNNALEANALPPTDVTYMGQLIAKHTGLSQQEAEKRVTTTYANVQKKKADAEVAAKKAAEKARKATIYATLWLFVSLLMGAFSASLTATWAVAVAMLKL